MHKLEKLADLFYKDVFKETSFSNEAERLYMIAGKLKRKAADADEQVAKKLEDVSRMLLISSNILKKL